MGPLFFFFFLTYTTREWAEKVREELADSVGHRMFSSESSSGQARKPGLEDGCNHGVMWGRVQGLGHNTAGL